MHTARLAVLAAAVAAAASLGGASAGARSAELVYFRTPSRNIHCAYIRVSGTPVHLRCEIRSGLVPRPARPKECRDAVWAAGYGMASSARPYVLCISDTVFDPRARVLGYGETWKRDGFRCTSRPTGLTCTNRTGRGFHLHKARSYTF